jgi:hypothetical protein
MDEGLEVGISCEYSDINSGSNHVGSCISGNAVYINMK